jgi:hypothetical protein
MNDQQTEQAIQAKGLNAPRIIPAQIEALMKRVTYTFIERPDNTTSTFCHAYLDGKFLLTTGHSACVSPENFNSEIGQGIAKSKAEADARSKLWELEGYVLYRSLEGERA